MLLHRLDPLTPPDEKIVDLSMMYFGDETCLALLTGEHPIVPSFTDATNHGLYLYAQRVVGCILYRMTVHLSRTSKTNALSRLLLACV